MIRFRKSAHAVAPAFVGMIFIWAAPVQADTTNTLDLSAGAGFSTNPGNRTGSSTSGFGRISANGNHTWITERSSASIHGFVENTTYLQHYGSQQIFDIGADANYAASPTVSLYGNLAFFGDFNGQLSNRLIGVPNGPPVTNPNNPLPPPGVLPSVFAFSGHSYRLDGQVGASIRSSDRSTISLTAGAQHAWFTGNPLADYTTYHGSAGYSLQVSEHTSLGPAIYLTHQDRSLGSSANILNPSLTGQTQLSETVTADGAVGILVVNDHLLGHTATSVSPSFSLSVCARGSLSSICGQVSHDAHSALNSPISTARGSSITTTADVSYYRRVSENGTIQASLYATHYSTQIAPANLNLRQTYLSAVAGYDHKVGHRLFAGITGGARRVFQTGPDLPVDFNANIYLRYRIGDLR